MSEKHFIGPAAIIEKKKKYIMPCLAHFYKNPQEMVKGSMQYLWDSNGKKYLDCYAGVSVMNCGHCNPEITGPMKAQIDEQIAETQKFFEHAETLRAEAQAAMKRMAAVVDAYDAEGMAGTATEGTGSGGIVPATAEDAVWGELSEDDELAGSHLEQLRMLFFTIASISFDKSRITQICLICQHKF